MIIIMLLYYYIMLTCWCRHNCQHTALHYACLGGHVEAVQLLVDKKADVTLKNTYNHSPLDLAIDNMHHDVVIAMLRNKRCAILTSLNLSKL